MSDIAEVDIMKFKVYLQREQALVPSLILSLPIVGFIIPTTPYEIPATCYNYNHLSF